MPDEIKQPAGEQKIGVLGPVVPPPEEVLKMEFKMDDGIQLAPTDKLMSEVVQDNERIVPTEKVIPNSEQKKEEQKAESKKEEQKAEPKKEDQKTAPAKEEQKTEEKKEEKKSSFLDVLKKPAAKTDEKGKEQKKEESVVRDYSVFDTDEEKEAARQMSGKAFDIFKGMKQKVKDTGNVFYQNKDAYLAHPEYTGMQRDLQYVNAELQFYNKQLELARGGDEYRKLMKYDENGQPVFSEPIKPTEAGIETRQSIMLCRQGVQVASNRINQFPKQYQKQYSDFESAVNAERAQKFAWAADPTLLDAELDLGGDMGTKTIKAIRQDLIDLFPKHFVNDAAVQVAADLLASILVQRKFYESKLAEQTTSTDMKKEEEKVEPSTTTRPSSKGSAFGGITEFSASGMPQMN